MDIGAILSAVRDSEAAVQAAGQAAWTYVQAREPDLAKAILDLGWSDAQAGRWLVTRGNQERSAPIDLVAIERTAELIAAIRKTEHGLF